MRSGTMSSVLVGLVLAISACGGKPKPPLTSDDTAKSDSGAESVSEATPTDADGGGGNADAGTATAAATPEPRPEPKDECTPMGVDFEKRARPKLKDCYAAAKKKDANLEGTVRISVEIDGLGKVKGMKITEKTLPDSVAQCMLKVVKATPLPEASKCPGRSLTIPMTFPTPR